jgi:hypothetical protein
MENIFKKIEETDEVSIYYSCPGKHNIPKDKVIEYYDYILSKNKKDWAWIIDSNNLSLSDTLEVGVSKDIIALINTKYLKKLKKIHIINPNSFTKIIYYTIYPFLSDQMKKLLDYVPE